MRFMVSLKYSESLMTSLGNKISFIRICNSKLNDHGLKREEKN